MVGKFITFEGSDGSGKTSVLQEIVKLMQSQNNTDFILTREPGGNKISEEIRNVILDKSNQAMDARTEALLYAAARRQHLVETILPALAANQVVLCDRFVDSSLAYQGAGRDLGMQEVYEMNLFATDGLQPDLTIYFDLEPEVGLARIKGHRQDEVNRLDEESLHFYQKVHDAYVQLADQEQSRIVVVDASQPFADVVADVVAILKAKSIL